MAKLTIMIGLPASGKSTMAEKLLQNGNTVRLNRDLLRTMLHCDKWSSRNEQITIDTEVALASHHLAQGKNVIIDDTNLNPSTVESWVKVAKQFDAKIEYQDFTNVPVAECLERDSKRAKSVGKSVIMKMAFQYLNYFSGANVIICDLDGTLCDISHRQHFVQSVPKNWKGFFEAIPGDTLREDVCEKLFAEALATKSKVIFVSARPEDYRTQTEEWFKENNIIQSDYLALIMRNSGDKRPDTEVKNDIYEKYLKNLNIIKVYDDRPSVIRMWRAKGLEVEDVGNGIEF